LRPPEYIQLYPTTLCNQRCSFCFNSETGSAADLAFDNALALLDILAENGVRHIDIMGGEPFLLPWMPDFIKTGLSRGFSLNISTNGSMPGLLQRLRGTSQGRFNIGVSLEGSTPEKHNRFTGAHNFASALESIKDLVSLGLDPIVKTVLNEETAEDIQDILNLIKGTGVRRYYLIHMDILSQEEAAMRKAIPYTGFLDFYKRIKDENPDIGVHRVNASCFDKNSLPPGVRCAGGVRKLSVMPDGAVFPCNLFHGLKEFEVGNIFRDRFSDIWEHPGLGFFRTHRENSCRLYECKNRTSCTGGCPAHGYYHYRNTEMTDIRCLRSGIPRCADRNMD
jgi:radical SAM protein with 4Fe4S-binding SPASM domain